MKNLLKLFLSVILSLTIVQYAAAQTYDFKLNLKKGQKYEQKMAMIMDMSESVSGQEIKIATKAHFVFKQEVKAIDKDGNYNIESIYSRVAMDVDAMGSKITYDSDKKDNGAGSEDLTKVFGGVIGKKFTVTISPKGKVIKVEGLKAIMDELSKGASPTTTQILSSTFDDKKMAANFSSSYDFFPDHPVKKGESWKHNTTVESIFPLDIQSTYTLKEVKGNIATIGMAADITMKNDSLPMQGMTVKVDIKGNYSGDYNMDLTTGQGTSANLTMPLKGTMEMMNMVVPIEINSIIETSATPAK